MKAFSRREEEGVPVVMRCDDWSGLGGLGCLP